MAKSLSRQVGILTLGRFFAYLAAFFVPMVNARVLGLDDIGLYKQYWLIVETVAGVLVMAFPNSLLYYFPRTEHPREKTTYLTQTLVYLVVMGFVSWAVYGVLDRMLGGGLGTVVHDYFWPLCLFTTFWMVSSLMDRLFVADKQPERQSAYFAVTSFLQAVTVILVVYYTRRVGPIILALLAFGLARFLFTLLYSERTYKPRLRTISRATLREQLSYALPLGFSAIFLMLFTQTDKFIITHYMDREMFAIYAYGAFQVPLIDIIRSSIWNVIFPIMAKYEKEGNHFGILELWQRATLKTAVMFFPLFVFLEVSARPTIVVLFTERFAQAAPVFMIYLLMLLSLTIETWTVLLVFRKNPFLVKVNIVAFFTNIVLSVAGYKAFGWLGVPGATVAVVFAQTVVNMYVGGQVLGVPLARLMPWGKMAMRFLVAVVPGVVLYFVYRQYPVGTFFELAIAGIGYFALYFAISFKLGYITAGEIKSMFGRASS